MPAGRLLIPAADIAQLVAQFKAGADATATVVVGGGRLGFLYLLYDLWNKNQDIAPALNIPKSMAGTATTMTATSTSACPDPI